MSPKTIALALGLVVATAFATSYVVQSGHNCEHCKVNKSTCCAEKTETVDKK